ncbi:uncharacterized protein LOC131946852, partial [Physella acuta]|uniref:uncharacterized protein LOC131946852 n=1 Tax=Physella acuta TaxID=109671 RepID=UPI0027DC41C0
MAPSIATTMTALDPKAPSVVSGSLGPEDEDAKAEPSAQENEQEAVPHRSPAHHKCFRRCLSRSPLKRPVKDPKKKTGLSKGFSSARKCVSDMIKENRKIKYGPGLTAAPSHSTIFTMDIGSKVDEEITFTQKEAKLEEK